MNDLALFGTVAIAMLCASCALDPRAYGTSENFRQQLRAAGCPALLEWEQIRVTPNMIVPGYEECFVVDYRIGPDGVPGNFAIRESHPPEVFQDPAIEAMQNWRFERRNRSTHVMQRFTFSTDGLLVDPHEFTDDLLCGAAAERDPSWSFCDQPLNDRK
ncbi:MAG TPA: energy transducer TonB [Nevskiaceae bacterium]|nr:energy transducer TonB [Nevskiaceae bacterium]